MVERNQKIAYSNKNLDLIKFLKINDLYYSKYV